MYGVILSYDIDEVVLPLLFREMVCRKHFNWNNVRLKSIFDSFFLKSELGDIMRLQEQIIC
jgi:hypothetical protein